MVARCADGNHDVRIFETLPEGDFIDETRPLPPQPHCAKPVQYYKGLKELQVRRERGEGGVTTSRSQERATGKK